MLTQHRVIVSENNRKSPDVIALEAALIAQEAEVSRHDGSRLQKHDAYHFRQRADRLRRASDHFREDMRRKMVFRECTDKSQCDRLDAVRLQLVVDGTHALEAEFKDVWRRDDVGLREPFRPQELQLGSKHAELLPTDVGNLAPQIDAVRRIRATELLLYVALGPVS